MDALSKSISLIAAHMEYISPSATTIALSDVDDSYPFEVPVVTPPTEIITYHRHLRVVTNMTVARIPSVRHGLTLVYDGERIIARAQYDHGNLYEIATWTGDDVFPLAQYCGDDVYPLIAIKLNDQGVVDTIKLQFAGRTPADSLVISSTIRSRVVSLHCHGVQHRLRTVAHPKNAGYVTTARQWYLDHIKVFRAAVPGFDQCAMRGERPVISMHGSKKIFPGCKTVQRMPRRG